MQIAQSVFGLPPAWQVGLTSALCFAQASLDLLQTESLKTNAEQVQTSARHPLSSARWPVLTCNMV